MMTLADRIARNYVRIDDVSLLGHHDQGGPLQWDCTEYTVWLIADFNGKFSTPFFAGGHRTDFESNVTEVMSSLLSNARDCDQFQKWEDYAEEFSMNADSISARDQYRESQQRAAEFTTWLSDYTCDTTGEWLYETTEEI